MGKRKNRRVVKKPAEVEQLAPLDLLKKRFSEAIHDPHLRHAVYVASVRLIVIGGLIYVATGDRWDHIHNFLLGYHVHILHTGLLGSSE